MYVLKTQPEYDEAYKAGITAVFSFKNMKTPKRNAHQKAVRYDSAYRPRRR